jgi:hypothetical protein
MLFTQGSFATPGCDMEPRCGSLVFGYPVAYKTAGTALRFIRDSIDSGRICRIIQCSLTDAKGVSGYPAHPAQIGPRNYS